MLTFQEKVVRIGLSSTHLIQQWLVQIKHAAGWDRGARVTEVDLHTGSAMAMRKS
jgi:hypothetical protein